jgi:hypothetical protein
LFAHGTSLVLDENLITTAKLHRWWWSIAQLSSRACFIPNALNKQFFPKTLVLKINWHGGVPCSSSFVLERGLDSGCWATNKS